MRVRWSSIALLSLLATGGLIACAPRPVHGPASPNGELAGRTAGAPQRCVVIQQSESFRLGAERTLLYGRGGTVWANRLGPDCAGIRPTAILITEPVSAHYCRGDRVRSLHPISRVPGPGCLLGDFVPYRR